MPVTIQKASSKDTDVIVSLIVHLLQDLNTQSGRNFNVDPAELIVLTNDLIKRDDFAAYIACNPDQDPIGVITIARGFAIYNGGDFGVITELYVDKTYRSMGIGEQLLHAAFEFAREMSWKKVEVGAPDKAEWPRTLAFYKRNGFTEKGPKLRIEL